MVVKFINVRQLLRNLSESTKELPVTVTQYGQPIFQIISMQPNSLATMSTSAVKQVSDEIEGAEKHGVVSKGDPVKRKIAILKEDPLDLGDPEPTGEFHQCSYSGYKCKTPAVIKKGNNWFCLNHHE
jgi:antitoxin (DNA-binding transcriptional repressor) of toxin-antitoxin stability system